jgi:hypothetical protein
MAFIRRLAMRSMPLSLITEAMRKSNLGEEDGFISKTTADAASVGTAFGACNQSERATESLVRAGDAEIDGFGERRFHR